MKSITKKVVALSAVFAMSASFAVSAATEMTASVADGAAVDNVTVNYTYTGTDSNAQATILVYTGDNAFDANGNGNNVAYINQAAIPENKAGSFNFAIRDSLKDETSFKVLVGGTDVATAASATLSFASTSPTITFEDDEAAFGEATNGTSITLPALPTKNPTTRYYWGWVIDGDDTETIYKVGDVVTISEDTKFIAKHFPKGDMSQDGSVDSTDSDIACAMELGDTDYITDNGFNEFWNLDEDGSGAIAGDMSGDGSVDSTDSDIAYAMELGDTDYIIDNGFDIFWE